MSDTFNVTASYDKPAGYNAGDIVKITISGVDVHVVTTTAQIGPVSLPIVAADGAQGSIDIPQTTFPLNKTTDESVVIDTTRPIVDTSPTPRTWVVSSDKLSITATA